MFKIYEDGKLIKETSSGIYCAIYQAFRYNNCNIEDSLSYSSVVYDFYLKLDYSVDINRLVDFICTNSLDVYEMHYRNIMEKFNEYDVM